MIIIIVVINYNNKAIFTNLDHPLLKGWKGLQLDDNIEFMTT